MSDDELQAFLNYAAQFLGNSGNFKSFGDAKFIPRLPERQFKAIASCAKGGVELFEKAQSLGGIYASDEAAAMHLGYPEQGHVTTYYPDSPNITKSEISEVSEFLESKKLLPENTRIRRTKTGGFEVLIASAQTAPGKAEQDVQESEWTLPSGKKVSLVYGDYSKEMTTIAHALEQASNYAANENEKNMLANYVKSFRTGSMNAFVDSQRDWIKDKGPTVESDIGFIETYRDPHGIRGEWEGFVAMVNQERTKAFGTLVNSAPDFIPKLPWGKDFEKDKFMSPDFTSLEVLTFAGSGIPAGINMLVSAHFAHVTKYIEPC